MFERVETELTFGEEHKEIAEEEEFKSDEDMVEQNSLLLQRIMLLQSQLAPIMDRMGRLMADFSPHLVQ